ncbi:hypothetical protein INT43_003750 [Umbelopsis isabellina]|uniref:Uncharacterized protein n=1 Tax=Mortierella isabellina TaxID=91625 RepID=A0A8H7UHE9_MORIS|nr:hypothetical protein INT43_003750 [Umbelopsis isabellina]
MSLEQTEFDYIVLGTGLIESILAAAIAKSGRSVLHIDESNYYGGKWASHSFSDLLAWPNIQFTDKIDSEDTSLDTPVSLNGLNIDGIQTVIVDAMKSRNRSMQHVEFEYFAETADQNKDRITEANERTNSAVIDATRADVRQQLEEHILNSLNDRFNPATKNGKMAIEFELDRVIRSLPPTSSVTFNVQDSVDRILILKDGLDSSRHYNFDLAPKLLTCRGEMVEVLIKSGIGRYLEFKGVEQSFVYDSESKAFDKVPVSKEDVFSTDSIALIDKRKLMRFLTFAMNDEEDTQDLGGDYRLC